MPQDLSGVLRARLRPRSFEKTESRYASSPLVTCSDGSSMLLMLECLLYISSSFLRSIFPEGSRGSVSDTTMMSRGLMWRGNHRLHLFSTIFASSDRSPEQNNTNSPQITIAEARVTSSTWIATSSISPSSTLWPLIFICPVDVRPKIWISPSLLMEALSPVRYTVPWPDSWMKDVAVCSGRLR